MAPVDTKRNNRNREERAEREGLIFYRCDSDTCSGTEDLPVDLATCSVTYRT